MLQADVVTGCGKRTWGLGCGKRMRQRVRSFVCSAKPASVPEHVHHPGPFVCLGCGGSVKEERGKVGWGDHEPERD